MADIQTDALQESYNMTITATVTHQNHLDEIPSLIRSCPRVKCPDSVHASIALGVLSIQIMKIVFMIHK